MEKVKKYHISKDGVLRECKAEKCSCKASPRVLHFNSLEAGQAYLDDYFERATSGVYDNMRLSSYVEAQGDVDLENVTLIDDHAIKYMKTSELEVILEKSDYRDIEDKYHQLVKAENLQEKEDEADKLESRLFYLATTEGKEEWKKKYAKDNNVESNVELLEPLTIRPIHDPVVKDATGEVMPLKVKEVIVKDSANGELKYDVVTFDGETVPALSVTFDSVNDMMEVSKFKAACKTRVAFQVDPIDEPLKKEMDSLYNKVNELRKTNTELEATYKKLDEKRKLNTLVADEIMLRNKLSSKYDKPILERTTLNKINSVYDDETGTYLVFAE